MLDLLFAGDRSNRIRADDEDEIVRCFDVAQDFLLPFGGKRDVLPVDPRFTVVGNESIAEPAHEVLVPAGIRNEDLCHENSVRSRLVPLFGPQFYYFGDSKKTK